jgi:hypothetical protein
MYVTGLPHSPYMLENRELTVFGRRQSWNISRYYPTIHLEKWIKTIKKPQNDWYFSEDLNCVHPRYTTRAGMDNYFGLWRISHT